MAGTRAAGNHMAIATKPPTAQKRLRPDRKESIVMARASRHSKAELAYAQSFLMPPIAKMIASTPATVGKEEIGGQGNRNGEKGER